jgi:hypothetical protein
MGAPRISYAEKDVPQPQDLVELEHNREMIPMLRRAIGSIESIRLDR